MIAGPIIAAVKAVLVSAWAWLLPWAGPVVAKAVPWLGLVPGLGSVKRWARVGLYVGVLALGVWGGVKVHAWWTGDRITQEEAAAQARAVTNAALERVQIEAERARLAAEKRALVDRAAALDLQAREVEQMQVQQDQFNDAMEADRNAFTQGDDVAVIGVDDGWLRAWQRRGR